MRIHGLRSDGIQIITTLHNLHLFRGPTRAFSESCNTFVDKDTTQFYSAYRYFRRF